MPSDPIPLPDDMIVHRVGPVTLDNFALKKGEMTLVPVGISVLLGGTAGQAANQMRGACPDPRKHSRIHELVKTVSSALVGAIRQLGYDVIAAESGKFPNHGRLTHPKGADGFRAEALTALLSVFSETTS